MIFIATFYSHFGAMSYKKSCDKYGYPAREMPVPRSLSSSCGTCVQYECENGIILDPMPEEVEQIVKVLDEGYEQIYQTE